MTALTQAPSFPCATTVQKDKTCEAGLFYQSQTSHHGTTGTVYNNYNSASHAERKIQKIKDAW